MAPEKIIREDTGFAGECDRIVSVRAYRSRIYGIKYITGLVFTYRSGATRTVGYTHGEPSREVSLGDNERISRLELLSGHCGVLEITVCAAEVPRLFILGHMLTVFSFTATASTTGTHPVSLVNWSTNPS